MSFQPYGPTSPAVTHSALAGCFGDVSGHQRVWMLAAALKDEKQPILDLGQHLIPSFPSKAGWTQRPFAIESPARRIDFPIAGVPSIPHGFERYGAMQRRGLTVTFDPQMVHGLVDHKRHLGNLRSQLLVSDPLTPDAIHEGIQTRQSVFFDVPFVKAERELIDVAAKMLGAGVMVNAVKSALQDGPNAFDTVGAGKAARVLTRRMVHGVVAKEQAIKSTKYHVIVGVQLAARFNVGMDMAMDRVQRAEFDYLRPGAPATLPHTQDGHLARLTPARMEPLRLVLVLFLAPKERFVNLYGATQLVDVAGVPARLTEPGEHEPCALLGYSDFLGELHGADTLAGSDEQVHRVNPLVERDVTAFEDRSGANSKVEVPAGVAAIEPRLTRRDPVGSLALGADDSVGPETALQINTGRLHVWEHLEQLEGADGGFGHLGHQPQALTDLGPHGFLSSGERTVPLLSQLLQVLGVKLGMESGYQVARIHVVVDAAADILKQINGQQQAFAGFVAFKPVNNHLDEVLQALFLIGRSLDFASEGFAFHEHHSTLFPHGSQVYNSLYTDDHVVFNDLDGLFYQHETVNHSTGEYARGPVSTNSIESVWAVMKRGIHGVYHQVSAKHLGRYVAEFTFRLNEGNVKEHTLTRLDSFVAAVVGRRITYKQVTA